MSTVQPRTASMIPTFDIADSRVRGAAEIAPGHPENAAFKASGDPATASGIKQESTSFIREVVTPIHYESPEDMRAIMGTAQQRSRQVAPVPRITIHAFCESPDVMSTLEKASSDRLMSRTTVDVFAGGIKAGLDFYQNNPAPNLIIVESRASSDTILAELNELAEVCDAGTRVLVIGYSNDIRFYRELTQRGVSEYVIMPVSVVSLVAAVSSIYQDASSGKFGQVYAFVGSKGGVGSSTIAHNVGWTIARNYGSDVVLADLDLPFGTAGLNFNIDSNQGIAEAIQDSSRLDEVLLDRLLTKCDDHFSLLTSPATLDTSYDLDPEAFTGLLEIAQANVPFTILDVPHLWTGWARNALVAADEIVITAVPDLANLRNTKNLIEFLKQVRPHDAPPKLVLNQVGMQKRPEIKPAEFAKTLAIDAIACIPFDAQLFGMAANNGKMIADTSAKSPAMQSFADIAAGVAGRKESKKERKSTLSYLRNLIERNMRKS